MPSQTRIQVRMAHAERSSTILVLLIAGIILLLILGSIWWVHRTDASPKAPLHSEQAAASFAA